jgi:hypothetical protein
MTKYIVGIDDGIDKIYRLLIYKLQLLKQSVQFPPPPPNISPRKSKEDRKALLIRAFLVLLLPRSLLNSYSIQDF